MGNLTVDPVSVVTVAVGVNVFAFAMHLVLHLQPTTLLAEVSRAVAEIACISELPEVGARPVPHCMDEDCGSSVWTGNLRRDKQVLARDMCNMQRHQTVAVSILIKQRVVVSEGFPKL